MMIEQVRALRDQGAFRRTVIGRRPDSIDWDEVTLSCGHRTLALPRLEFRQDWDSDECMKEALKQKK